MTAGDGTGDSRTWSEMVDDPFVSDELREDRLIDEILGLMATLLVRRGQRDEAQVLARLAQVVVENDDRSNTLDFMVEYEPEDADDFAKYQDRLRNLFNEVVERRRFPVDWYGQREVMPEVKYGWRAQLEAALGTDGKRPTNHARKIRPNRPQFVEDWLAFTNEGEHAVYQALKSLQEQDLPGDDTLGIYPLAGGRVRGKTWEPDFLITYKGRAGVLEVDGPHHNARRALDITRDHLFQDSGVAEVDRISVETVGNKSELDQVLRRFIRRLGQSR